MAHIIILAAAVLLMIALVIASAISRSAKDDTPISHRPPSSGSGQTAVGNSAIGHGGPAPGETMRPSDHRTRNEGAPPVSPDTSP